jgi:hypothetical protein
MRNMEQRPVASTPGDIGFVSQPGFINWWIRFAQRRKYGRYSVAARWNHVFIVTDIYGGIIEADPGGVTRANLRKYRNQDFELRRPPYGPGGAAIVVAAATEHLGRKYGFLTIASVALSLLTGTKLRFGISGQEICSGEAADDMTRANIDCGPDESFDTPADLFNEAITQNWIRP